MNVINGVIVPDPNATGFNPLELRGVLRATRPDMQVVLENLHEEAGPPNALTASTATDSLAAFIYLLARDEVPFGVIERILADIERRDNNFVYSEAAQAEYAQKIAKRLLWRIK